MYNILLVDDEYMILEGLKRLVPYDQFNMQVVATAENAEQAILYCQNHSVDIVITDVTMPDMTGLELIQNLHQIIPNAMYIIISGYQEFDYVKTALSLGVVDYLVKPISKIELLKSLKKIQMTLQNKQSILTDVLMHKHVEKERLLNTLERYQTLWLNATKEKQNSDFLAYTIFEFCQTRYYIYLSEKPLNESLYHQEIDNDLLELYPIFCQELESLIFFKKLSNGNKQESFTYYTQIYNVINQGQLDKIIEIILNLKEQLLMTTPSVTLTKQLFIQIMMDIFHLFNKIETTAIEQIIQTINQMATFDKLVQFVLTEIESIFAKHRFNHNVSRVLDIIRQEYQQELVLKQISERLFLSSVYLGQIIKKETNDTFAELLNKQRIKVAQQLLLTTNLSVEEICYEVGYSNVGYFYKVFKRLCGESPKVYRQHLLTLKQQIE